MMKVEGQRVERRRRENRGAVGAEGAEEGRVWGAGVPSPVGLSRNAAFWMQSDAFSDITRPVQNSLH